jgi:MFS family permease
VLGGVFGFVSVYLRRFLEETPVFQEMKARRSLAREIPIKTVLRAHRRETLLALALTWVLTAAIVVVILFTPAYLQQIHHVPAPLALRANSVATFMFALGCLCIGWANDVFGTRASMIAGFGGLLISSYQFYARLPGTPDTLLVMYSLTGFFVGAATMVPIVAVRLFPAPVRFSGLSFSYNVSYAIFGGLTPIVLTLWLRSTPMAPAYYVGGLAVLGMALAILPRSDSYKT